MAKSTIDLDELKKFRDLLLQAIDGMVAEEKRLFNSVTIADAYWRDPQHKLLVEKLKPFSQDMRNFELLSLRHIEWMDKKRDAGRKYLEGR